MLHAVNDVIGIAVEVDLVGRVAVPVSGEHHAIGGAFAGCVLQGKVTEVGPAEFDEATEQEEDYDNDDCRFGKGLARFGMC